MPHPTAAPLTAAMTGTSVRSSTPAAGVRRGVRSRLVNSLLAATITCFTSSPEQKAGSRPVITRHRAVVVRDRVGQLVVGRERQCVARLGTIDGDDADVVAFVVLDLGVHARLSAVPRRSILAHRSPGSHLILTLRAHHGHMDMPLTPPTVPPVAPPIAAHGVVEPPSVDTGREQLDAAVPAGRQRTLATAGTCAVRCGHRRRRCSDRCRPRWLRRRTGQRRGPVGSVGSRRRSADRVGRQWIDRKSRACRSPVDRVGAPAGDADESDRRPAPGHAAGTGFVLSADGYIVTNNHVIAEGDDTTITFSDGSEESATIVGGRPDP